MEQGPQPPIAGIAQRLANLRQRPCLVYCGDIPHELDKTAIRSLADALPGDSLDVLLTSCGGSGDSAAWWVWRLREKISNLAVFVPDHAKSAATLFCMGANEIVFGPDGELGPIDPHPSRRSVHSYPASQSANTLANGFSALSDITVSLLKKLEAHNRDALNLEGEQCLELACKVTTDLLAPLYANTNLRELGESRRALDHARFLARPLVRQGTPSLSPPEVDMIIDRLLTQTYFHGYAVDVHDAMGIGLPARIADEQERALLVEAQAAVAGISCEQTYFALATVECGDDPDEESTDGADNQGEPMPAPDPGLDPALDEVAPTAASGDAGDPSKTAGQDPGARDQA